MKTTELSQISNIYPINTHTHTHACKTSSMLILEYPGELRNYPLLYTPGIARRSLLRCSPPQPSQRRRRRRWWWWWWAITPLNIHKFITRAPRALLESDLIQRASLLLALFITRLHTTAALSDRGETGLLCPEAWCGRAEPRKYFKQLNLHDSSCALITEIQMMALLLLLLLVCVCMYDNNVDGRFKDESA